MLEQMQVAFRERWPDDTLWTAAFASKNRSGGLRHTRPLCIRAVEGGEKAVGIVEGPLSGERGTASGGGVACAMGTAQAPRRSTTEGGTAGGSRAGAEPGAVPGDVVRGHKNVLPWRCGNALSNICCGARRCGPPRPMRHGRRWRPSLRIRRRGYKG